MNFLFSKVLQDKLFSKIYSGLRFLLPIVIFLIIVFLEMSALAYMLLFLSKWRLLTKHPKFWWFNLRINMVDLIVGGSIIYFMSAPDVLLWQQILWLLGYVVWVLYLKSIKRSYGHIIQGIVAQALGTTVFSYNLHQMGTEWLLVGIWFVALFSTWHIVTGLGETKYNHYLVYIWSIFSIQLAWILLHWQINFWLIPRLTLIQTLLLTAVSTLYILHSQDKLTQLLKKQIIVSTLTIVIAILLLSTFQNASI